MNLPETLLAVMLQLAPPERAHAFPGFEEAPADRAARYAEIARDVADVVDEEGAAAGRSKRWTATLVLAVAFHESGFALDVDRSTCWQPKVGRKRCDGGRAFGLMQVHADRRFSRRELMDRRTNIRAGLRKLKASLAMCATSLPSHQLAAYGSGRCNVGLAGARSLAGMHRRVDGLFEMAAAASSIATSSPGT